MVTLWEARMETGPWKEDNPQWTGNLNVTSLSLRFEIHNRIGISQKKKIEKKLLRMERKSFKEQSNHMIKEGRNIRLPVVEPASEIWC